MRQLQLVKVLVGGDKCIQHEAVLTVPIRYQDTWQPYQTSVLMDHAMINRSKRPWWYPRPLDIMWCWVNKKNDQHIFGKESNVLIYCCLRNFHKWSTYVKSFLLTNVVQKQFAWPEDGCETIQHTYVRIMILTQEQKYTISSWKPNHQNKVMHSFNAIWYNLFLINL